MAKRSSTHSDLKNINKISAEVSKKNYSAISILSSCDYNYYLYSESNRY